MLALAQIGFLSWFIVARAAVLRDGREVMLKVEPIDPRDLLRGDYVWLRYEVSSVPVSLITNMPPGNDLLPSREIYVRLKQQADGSWRVSSAKLEGPLDTAAAGGRVGRARKRGLDLESGRRKLAAGDVRHRALLCCGRRRAGRSKTACVERIELPDGEGTTNAHMYSVVAAVGPDGTAQIKRLMEDGKMLFEEPLY